ncbi:VOC family protein [Streptomyces laurentii]|uniref:VOC family protein n=1 Tax=Streptomyces laurentii TaxID=39478 RepID=UPI00369422EA
MLVALDHVQLAAPAGSEPQLRAYYEGVLGMTEIPKPPVLAARGGCWFAAAGGAVQVHVGVEVAPAEGGTCHFRPARKAHPGLRVSGIDAFAARVAAHGGAVVWDDHLPGHRRFYSEDPVGNRLEFLEPVE